MDAKSSSETLRNEWHAYLRQHSWSHLLHLTTRYPYPRPRLEAEVEHRMIRRLARSAQHRIPWFAAFELSYQGCWHAHVLIGAAEALTDRQFRRAWDAGFSHIDRLEDPDSAIGYAVKTLGEHPDNYARSARWIGAQVHRTSIAA